MLDTAEMFWLSTVRGDGRPHVAPLPAVWSRDRLHICTGPLEQKAKNLAAEPRCILTTGTNQMNSGLDVVVEGTAVRVTDPSELKTLAQLWKSKLDWDFTVRDNGFGDNEGNLIHVYGIVPSKILAFGKGDSFTQTRFRFRPQ
ncbi:MULTISPECIES: pyridoxamine 5'-phosphate oxidase family protein [unclassified Nocardia]|uniref:pyridoxamine 5'-phosphate oxidase family protein n=1 Tax=unclassified Nocardia TaxID=2637762 RepID=UPI0027E1C7FD|nr:MULTISPECIES: pyridoxamine 5'-phosphate oxidase family protein [unclassified Nocardia]